MGKAAQTKQYIIEKSAAVFNKRGFAGTSLQDLTSATGLTKGSIYGNFENKDDVAIAVFHYNIKKMQLFFGTEMSKKSTFRDMLLTYPEQYEKFLSGSKFPDGGCPIMNTATEADDTHLVLKKISRKALLDWKDNIALLIEEGKTAGEFKPETSAETAAVGMLALIEGATLFGKLTENEKYMHMALEPLRKLIMEL